MDELESTQEKKEELCELLKGQSFELHRKDDGEYRYLEEDSICITVNNADGSHKMYLDLEEEFTLTFAAFHAHYGCFRSEYEEMKEEIRGILANETGSVSIYYFYDGELKWLGSGLAYAEDIRHLSVKEIFSHVYKSKEFRERLEKYGGEAHYEFWDAAYDRVIKIESNSAAGS